MGIKLPLITTMMAGIYISAKATTQRVSERAGIKPENLFLFMEQDERSEKIRANMNVKKSAGKRNKAKSLITTEEER